MSTRAGIFFLVVAVVATGAALADSPKVSLSEANGLFDGGKYAAAAEAYRAIIDSGRVGAEIYYNLATALERSGKPVEAVLNYERALMLDPGLRVAHNNLALLAAERGIELPPPSWTDTLTTWVHPSILLHVGALAGWAGMFGLVWIIFGTDMRNVALIVVSSVLIVGGGSMVAAGWMSDPRITSTNLAVITSAEPAEVRAEPANNSNRVASLPAGSPVGVIKPLGAWTYVSLANGKTGWVPTAVLTMVMPGKEV